MVDLDVLLKDVASLLFKDRLLAGVARRLVGAQLLLTYLDPASARTKPP